MVIHCKGMQNFVSALRRKRLPEPQLEFLNATLLKHGRLLVALYEGDHIHGFSRN